MLHASDFGMFLMFFLSLLTEYKQRHHLIILSIFSLFSVSLLSLFFMILVS